MSLPSALLAAFAALILVASHRRLQGTTLVAPLAWAIFAVTTLAGAELAAALSPSANWLPHLRLLAAGTTFCPLMALLGAKRPQDRGWQFVVLSLWGLVAFYGLTELAYRPHRPPELHPVVRWLLVAPLVGMGLVNHLFTRYAIPAILVAVGQVVLLSPQLPEIQPWLPARLVLGPQAGAAVALTGIVFLSVAVGLAIVLAQARVNTDPRNALDPAFDRVWLDFRDQFGTFWGLRVAARFNQTAEQLSWGVRLTWHGLTRVEAAANGAASVAKSDDPRAQVAMRQVLQSLLKRFVDADWLARRWGHQELSGRRTHQAQDQEVR
jgi:hypothetical protein